MTLRCLPFLCIVMFVIIQVTKLRTWRLCSIMLILRWRAHRSAWRIHMLHNSTTSLSSEWFDRLASQWLSFCCVAMFISSGWEPRDVLWLSILHRFIKTPVKLTISAKIKVIWAVSLDSRSKTSTWEAVRPSKAISDRKRTQASYRKAAQMNRWCLGL